MEGDDDGYGHHDEEDPISLGAMVPEHNDWSFSFEHHDEDQVRKEGGKAE